MISLREIICRLCNWFSVGPSAAFPYMFRHVICHLSSYLGSPSFVPSAFATRFLSAGSVPCLEVVAAVVVEAAVQLPLHPSHLHCQSINLQTIATGEKKC